jgi:hypothetical protein
MTVAVDHILLKMEKLSLFMFAAWMYLQSPRVGQVGHTLPTEVMYHTVMVMSCVDCLISLRGILIISAHYRFNSIRALWHVN